MPIDFRDKVGMQKNLLLFKMDFFIVFGGHGFKSFNFIEFFNLTHNSNCPKHCSRPIKLQDGTKRKRQSVS